MTKPHITSRNVDESPPTQPIRIRRDPTCSLILTIILLSPGAAPRLKMIDLSIKPRRALETTQEGQIEVRGFVNRILGQKNIRMIGRLKGGL